MLNAYAKLSHWISVKDQLPDPGKVVLVSGGMVAYRIQGGKWLSYYSSCEIQWEVTHWMPMPDPPPAPVAPVDPMPTGKLPITVAIEHLKDTITSKHGTNASNSWWDLTRFLCGNLK